MTRIADEVCSSCGTRFPRHITKGEVGRIEGVRWIRYEPQAVPRWRLYTYRGLMWAICRLDGLAELALRMRAAR